MKAHKSTARERHYKQALYWAKLAAATEDRAAARLADFNFDRAIRSYRTPMWKGARERVGAKGKRVGNWEVTYIGPRIGF